VLALAAVEGGGAVGEAWRSWNELSSGERDRMNEV